MNNFYYRNTFLDRASFLVLTGKIFLYGVYKNNTDKVSQMIIWPKIKRFLLIYAQKRFLIYVKDYFSDLLNK